VVEGEEREREKVSFTEPAKMKDLHRTWRQGQNKKLQMDK
jgi:hypothetical protein